MVTAYVVHLAFGERFSDVPVQLPTYLLAMPLVAVAIERLPAALSSASGQRRLGAAITGAVLALGPLAALRAVRPRSRPLSALPDLLLPGLLVLLALAFLASAYLIAMRLSRTRRKTAEVAKVVGALFLLCALATASVSAWWMVGQNREMVTLKSRLLATGEQLEEETLLVSTWSQGILFEHYNDLEIYSGVFVEGTTLASDPATLNDVRLEEVARFEAQLDKHGPVLLMTESREATEKLAASGYRSRPLEGFTYFTRRGS